MQNLIARSPELTEENDRLKELNKEMMEALENILQYAPKNDCYLRSHAGYLYHAARKAEDVIKKANGESP